MTNPSLVILAAGMGSRYGGLKQLDQLGPSGETIIDYSLHDALEAGFKKIVFVIRKSFAEEFKDAVRLYPDRKSVDQYNTQKLSQIAPNSILRIKARHSSSYAAKCSAEMAKGLPSFVHLAINARVMVTSNIAVEKEVVNGSLGTVVSILYHPDSFAGDLP